MWSPTFLFLIFLYLKLVIPYIFFLFFFKTQYPILLTFQITPKTLTIPHHLNNSLFSFHPNMILPLKTYFYLFTSLFQYEILFQSTYSIFFLFFFKVNNLSTQISKLFFSFFFSKSSCSFHLKNPIYKVIFIFFFLNKTLYNYDFFRLIKT